jgi:small subunit ribosomal protein S18
MIQKKKRRQIIIKPLNEKCPFCVKKTTPSYKEVEELAIYITDRARIMPAARSGVCSKHQRILGREIKRARFLALLPIIEKV